MHHLRNVLLGVSVLILTACSVDLSALQRQAPTAIPTLVMIPSTPPLTPTPEPSPVIPTPVAQGSALEQQQQVLIDLYKRVNPAVVSIDIVGQHPALDGIPQSQTSSQGSGFLIDNQGHIVTNNHVVDDATRYQVNFSDGLVVEASLVGTDPGSDIAVLKVDEWPDNAVPLELADSKSVSVGQTAIAIGNPFGLQNTLTVGVVSGLGRSLSGPNSSMGRFSIPNVIQTDAAINPGNSGGPLLNIYGQVIGINTAIRSESGTFEGIGYAVPSNAIARVVPALISTGRYDHPWMGIVMRSIDPLFASHFDLPARQGVLVLETQANSPADRGGLRGGHTSGIYGNIEVLYDGDIIVAVNQNRVRSSDDLLSYLELETSVGDTIELSILRNGEPTSISIKLGARPTN